MTGLRRSALVIATVVAAFSGVLLGGAGLAGAQTVPPVEVVGADLTAFPEVRLAVAVSGEVDESALEEVEVTENGEPVEAQVTALSEEAVDVILAVDVSGSMEGEPLAGAKEAALQFLDELPDAARTAVVSFDTTARVVSELTSDRDASRAAVEDLAAGGGTALYDALALVADQVGSSDAGSAVVVLSDGADTSSQSTLESVSETLEGVDAQFYLVSLETENTAGEALSQLAEAAGGRVVAAGDPEALAEAYVDLGQRISNRYEVVFQSATADPTATFEITVGSGESAAVDIALPDRDFSGGPTTTEAAAQAPPERLVHEGDAGPLEQGWALWLGVALVAIALGVIAYVVIPEPGRRPRRRSLASDRAVDPDSGAGERIVASVRDTATRIGSRAVERTERSGVIDASLDRAGIIMRAGEFVAAVAGVVIVASVVLYLLMGIVGLALGVFVPILGAPAFLRFLTARRNRKFAEQLGDTLIMMAGALRSGFGLGAAIDSVAHEMEAPISVEFQRAMLETRLGRKIDDALAGVAERVQNEDFGWVVDAIRIHGEVGGDLAEILDQVAETIRGRTRLRRQIAALTAEGRLSALVLGCLPIGMGLILYMTNREYLEPLFTRTGGQIMLGFSLLLLVTGAAWLKKLIDVEL